MGLDFAVGILQAPWVDGMMPYWCVSEVKKEYIFDPSSQWVDLVDHRSLFWIEPLCLHGQHL